MLLENLIEQEFKYTATAISCDFIEGQERDILRHFLGDRIGLLTTRAKGILEQWVYDNWENYIQYAQVASPYIQLKGYAIYTPFEIFVDLSQVEGLDKNDYIVSGGEACINTGYDCLVVDFSDVNFAEVLLAER